MVNNMTLKNIKQKTEWWGRKDHDTVMGEILTLFSEGEKNIKDTEDLHNKIVNIDNIIYRDKLAYTIYV